MSSFDQYGSLTFPFSPPSAELDQLKREASHATGLEAVLHVMLRKRIQQRGTLDANIIIVVAGTGAGKSTTMVRAIFQRIVQRMSGKRTFIVTQPRVVLASTAPTNIEQIFGDLRVGREMGYTTGPKKLASTTNISLLFCTTQVLGNYIRILPPEIFGRKFPIVMVDEAHETSMEMLLTLRSIKEYLAVNEGKPYCPLFIVTSATIDPPTYLEYFGANPESPYNSVFIAGTTPFPREEEYLSLGYLRSKDMDKMKVNVDMTIKEIRGILDTANQSPDGLLAHTDVLVFWSTPTEIERFLTALEEPMNQELGDRAQIYRAKVKEEEPSPMEGKWNIILCSFAAPDALNLTPSFRTIYRDHRPKEIKLIAGNVVVEAGATLRNLRIVLDGGRALSPIIFPLAAREIVMFLPISEFSRTQRFGRVGRTGPGRYVGLFDEEAKRSLKPTSIPSTLVSSSVPSSMYTILITKTLSMYKEITGSPSTLGKILAMRRCGYKLPSTDIANEGQLLAPISMDTCVRIAERLTTIGLMEWDGALSYIGLQAAAFRGMGLAEIILRVNLLNSLIHPIDVDILCQVVNTSISRAEVASRVNWADAITRFYKVKFTVRDPPPRRDDVIEVFDRVMRCFHSLMNGKVTVDIPPHRAWGEFNVAEGFSVVFEALERYATRSIEGAFYSDIIIDTSNDIRGRSFNRCRRALETVEQMLMGKTEQVEEKVVGVL